MHCNMSERLSEVIYRTAALCNKQPSQIRIYDLSAEKRANAVAQLKAAEAEQARQAKKKAGIPNWPTTRPAASNDVANSGEVEFPPLDETKRLRDLGIENDTAVCFVIQNDDGVSWETPMAQTA